MCAVTMLQLYYTVEHDESQSTLKLQLITLHQKHLLAFGLEMWKHSHLGMTIRKSQEMIYLSCKYHKAILVLRSTGKSHDF